MPSFPRFPRRAALVAGLVLSVRAADPDVLVYSGAPGGIAAAILAARQGARVVLVEPTRHVGGLSTSGINTAETEHMLKWTIGGFADEFYRRLGRHYGTGKPEYYFESGVAEAVYLDLLREAGVEIRQGAPVERAEREGARLASITLADGSLLRARVFVDASYEGDVMALAGVPCAVGREGREEFGEEAAGIRLDPSPRAARTVDDQGRLLPGISGWVRDFREGAAHPAPMNYNFRLTVTRDPALRAPIPEPARYDPGRYALLAQWLAGQSARGKPARLGDVLDLYNRRNGKLELNNKQSAIISLGHFGGQFGWAEAAPAGRAALFQDHLDHTLGLLHFLARDESVPEPMRLEMRALGLHRGEFADNGHLPHQLYVRESRRMRGAYVMRQHDVWEDRRKPDGIGLGSHFIDSHHVQRLAVSEDAFVNEGRIWRRGRAYQIPYRALTPARGDCDNLLVPVAASFTHVAFCTLRVESTWMVAGHAAGVAAALAARAGTPVQDLDVAALRDLLRTQGQVVDFLPGQPEQCEDLNGPPEF